MSKNKLLTKLKIKKLKNFILKILYCPQKIFWVDNELFFHGRPTNVKNNMIAFNKNHAIKVENFKYKNKKNNLKEEANILKYLTNCGNISNPKFIKEGKHITGRPYSIMDRINEKGKANIADLLLSILEQQKTGILHRDINEENIIFDGRIAKIIDYDQSEYQEEISKMLPLESIKHFTQHNKYTHWCKNCNPLYILIDNYFNLEQTHLYKKMTQNGMILPYYSINQDGVFAKGKYDIDVFKTVLDKIHFDKSEKVLDFGCNTGSLSFYLKNRGCDVFSFDTNIEPLIFTKILSNIFNSKCTVAQIDLNEKEIIQKYNTIFLLNDDFFNEIVLDCETENQLFNRTDRIVLKVTENDFEQYFENFSVTEVYKVHNNDFSIVILTHK